MSKKKVDKGKVCAAVKELADHYDKEVWTFSDYDFGEADLNDREAELANNMMNALLGGRETTFKEVEDAYHDCREFAGHKPKSSVKDACAESVGQAHARLRHAAINWPGKKLRTRAHFLCDKLEDLSKAMGSPFPKTD